MLRAIMWPIREHLPSHYAKQRRQAENIACAAGARPEQQRSEFRTQATAIPHPRTTDARGLRQSDRGETLFVLYINVRTFTVFEMFCLICVNCDGCTCVCVPVCVCCWRCCSKGIREGGIRSAFRPKLCTRRSSRVAIATEQRAPRAQSTSDSPGSAMCSHVTD